MSGKGDSRRPGKNYADNWELAFKPKKILIVDEKEKLDVMCGKCWLEFDSVKCTFKCNVKKGN